MNHIIEFELHQKYSDVEITGYVYADEIDDEKPLNFYNQYGLEEGHYVPANPYSENEFLHTEYEELKINFQSDDMLLQFLSDNSDECHKVIDRGEYILLINRCKEFEDTLCVEDVISDDVHHRQRISIADTIRAIITNDARFTRANHNTIVCEIAGDELMWNVSFGDREIADAFCNSMKQFMRRN